MKTVLRFFLLLIAFNISLSLYAQEIKIKERHKVKKSETLFGIAKNYGITIEELSEVNPEMNMPGYSLKKGDYINIPYTNDNKIVNNTTEQKQPTAQQLPISRPIKVGVMLPLHDINGDGKRMIEYYRGLLLSCDRLKKDNISIDINAWNVPIDADIRTTLLENEASKCDIIFGPLYTSMVKPLADFCQKNDIMMVIPFSISGNDVAVNSHIFQVYQAQEDLNKITTQQFIGQFKDYHPIIVDAGDVTSDKGLFTKELRQRLESVGLSYSITHLKASDADFMKCFSKNGRNIVIINTGKSPELNTLFQRLDKLKAVDNNVQISLFGYVDWFLYTNVYKDYFHKYDTYIPTTFYYNPTSNDTRWVEANYKKWFKNDMMYAIPHFGLTGFDHGCFFIGGFHKFGKTFNGMKGQSTYRAVQTPLRFRKVGNSGGMQNETLMFVHYKTDKAIDAINF